MPARLYSLMLTEFSFPKKLDNDKANFRFVVTVRYVAARGKLVSETTVLPGLDSYWECDTRRHRDWDYLRRPGLSELAIERIDPWDRLILHMRAEAIHSLQFKVFDVDRKDAWDRIQDVLRDFVGAILHLGHKAIPSLPPPIRNLNDSVGSVAEDLETWVLQKLAAQKDKVLFRGSHFFIDPSEPVAGPVGGRGVGGQYAIGFEVTGS